MYGIGWGDREAPLQGKLPGKNTACKNVGDLFKR